MNYRHIIANTENQEAVIMLNRPPLNVLNIEMMDEINTELDCLMEAPPNLLVFKATGKAFSAGVDVGEHVGDLMPKMIHAFHGMFRRMDALAVPSLAVVQGAALGGGCELAVYCDMVIASERAKFGQPEIKVGVFPPIAALALPRMIGMKKTLEFLLTGDVIDAGEALAMGLVNRVVPPEALETEAEAFLCRLRVNSGAVLKLTRKAVLEGRHDDVEKGLQRIEDIYMNRLMKTHDAHEGLTAFLEKRTPAWKNA